MVLCGSRGFSAVLGNPGKFRDVLENLGGSGCVQFCPGVSRSARVVPGVGACLLHNVWVGLLAVVVRMLLRETKVMFTKFVFF